LSEANGSRTLSVCLTGLRFGVPFKFQLLQEATHLAGDIYEIYCTAKCVHPNTVLKIKNTPFLYLPDMDSTSVILRCFGVSNFPRVSQNTVEPHRITTTKIH